MKRHLDMWSLVVVGKWNPAILSPQWLQERVFQGSSVVLLFSTRADAPPRIEISDIRITVTHNHLQFWPLKDDDEVLNRIEQAAKFILQTLEYTPVSAFGENFHYTAQLDKQPALIAKALDLPDTTKLEETGRVQRIDLMRAIVVDNHVLNFKLTRDQLLHFDLNYHYDAPDAKRAAELVPETLAQNRAHGMKFLHSTYGLTLEEDEEDDE